MKNENFIAFVRKNRGLFIAEDARSLSDDGFLPSVRNLLDNHDRRYHPHGYKPGQKCRYREELRKLTDEDSFDPAQVSETAQMKLDESEAKELQSTKADSEENDPVSEWLPKMKEEIFAKVNSLLKGSTTKENSNGIGFVEGPSVKNDDDIIDQIQAIVDAARAAYGLEKEGIRMTHYESGSPYVGKKPRIIFPYYKKGESKREDGDQEA